MSSHRLDVSGARALTSTLNDPASTAAQTTAKAGDDATITLGNFREIRLVLPSSAKVERRERTSRSLKVVEGRVVQDDDGKSVYDEKVSEELVLVLPGTATLFGRASSVEPLVGAENTPHTSLYVKRWGDELHYVESGKLLEAIDVPMLLADWGV